MDCPCESMGPDISNWGEVFEAARAKAYDCYEDESDNEQKGAVHQRDPLKRRVPKWSRRWKLMAWGLLQA